MKSTSRMTVVSRPFAPRDLVAGHPALDLVNTVTARDTDAPRDWLDGYARVLEWARLAGVLDERAVARLRSGAAASPRAAAGALMRLKQFREALHDACSALLSGARPPRAALDCLAQVWHEAQQRTDVDYVDGAIVARVSFARSGLDLPRDRLAAGALELVCRLPFDRARICRGERCGWLFLDTSKGGRRVWCDMATCGNAAKTQRHRRRPHSARS